MIYKTKRNVCQTDVSIQHLGPEIFFRDSVRNDLLITNVVPNM